MSYVLSLKKKRTILLPTLLKTPAFITEKYVREREGVREREKERGNKEGYSVEEGKKDLKINSYVH